MTKNVIKDRKFKYIPTVEYIRDLKYFEQYTPKENIEYINKLLFQYIVFTTDSNGSISIDTEQLVEIKNIISEIIGTAVNDALSSFLIQQMVKYGNNLKISDLFGNFDTFAYSEITKIGLIENIRSFLLCEELKNLHIECMLFIIKCSNKQYSLMIDTYNKTLKSNNYCLSNVTLSGDYFNNGLSSYSCSKDGYLQLEDENSNNIYSTHILYEEFIDYAKLNTLKLAETFINIDTSDDELMKNLSNIANIEFFIN